MKIKVWLLYSKISGYTTRGEVLWTTKSLTYHASDKKDVKRLLDKFKSGKLHNNYGTPAMWKVYINGQLTGAGKWLSSKQWQEDKVN